MSKVTHTHRGHCQLCACVQAIDPKTGLIAKHGYTVQYGYFSGTCPGSERFSLHVSRVLADEHIKQARQEAATCLKLAEDYRTRVKTPGHVASGVYEWYADEKGRRRERETMVKFEDATEYHQRRGIVNAVSQLEHRATMCEHYAKDLGEWADKITGKVDAYAVSDLESTNWKVGDTIRIGGKKGFDAVIEAIENQPYQTRGWGRNGGGSVMIPHARITRPERPAKVTRDGYVSEPARPAKTYWEPLRHVKRVPSKLAEELRKAGKL